MEPALPVEQMDLLRVSAWSNPKSVAGAIAGVLRERGEVDVQIIGAAALNQAVKAIAIARSYVAGEGIDPICIPGFQDIEINGEGRTAIRIRVEDRSGGPYPKPTHVAAEATEPGEPSLEPAGDADPPL
jgi:stage V sporulation protein S